MRRLTRNLLLAMLGACTLGVSTAGAKADSTRFHASGKGAVASGTMSWHERGRDGSGVPYYEAEFRGHVRDTRNDGRCAVAYITYKTYFRGRWRMHSKRAGKACGKGASAAASWDNKHAKDARLHVRRVRAKHR